jgi:hypothetical protein
MGAISFSLDPQLAHFLAGALPLKLFVETGTFKGDSLRIARQFFAECHSVEMSDVLYQEASQAFRSQDRIHLHHGASPAFLRGMRERLAQTPTLYWLDAHWCVADNTVGADSQSPLLQELDAIGALHSQSVLLIDDARLYLCPPPKPHRMGDWPDFHAIVRQLLSMSSTHRLMIYNDVIVFYPQQIVPQLAEYARSHGVDWLILAQQVALFRQHQDEQHRHPKPRGLRRLFRRRS